MFDLSVTWGTLAALAGAIITISAAYKAVRGIVDDLSKPSKERNAQQDKEIGENHAGVSELKEKIAKHDQMLDNDNHQIKLMQRDIGMILYSLKALVEHFATNNSIENLKKIDKEMNYYITTERHGVYYGIHTEDDSSGG